MPVVVSFYYPAPHVFFYFSPVINRSHASRRQQNEKHYQPTPTPASRYILSSSCLLARPLAGIYFSFYLLCRYTVKCRTETGVIACRESFTRSFVGALSVIWNERGDSRQQTSPPYPLPHPPSRFDQTPPRRGANSVLPPASHFQSTPFCRLQWNVTSSTKPEAHNVSRRKGRLQVKICGWADMASVDREPIKGVGGGATSLPLPL